VPRENVADLSDKLAEKMRASAARAPKGDSAACDLITTDKGAIRPCEWNANLLMAGDERYGDLHWDEFLGRVRFGKRDWTDHDDREALIWLQSTFRVHGFTLGQVRSAVLAIAYSRRKDLLLEFLEELPEWDGTPRIESAFIDAWGAPESSLMLAASRNFFIAMVARAMRPGCQVDSLWVFEGPQGVKKSLSLRTLGQMFHAEITAPVGTTDFLRELRGVLLAELSELDSLRGREASTVKRVTTATVDRYVDKWAVHAQAHPRRAIMVATTNEGAYWQDSTGARRLIPVPVGDIRIDLIESQRLQWFAEARARFEAGEAWWEFPEEIREQQEARQIVDAWEDELRRYMRDGRSSPAGGITPWPNGWISSSEIMRDWLHLQPQHQGNTSSTRLQRVMKRLGYVPQRGRTDSGQQRGWAPKHLPLPAEEAPRATGNADGDQYRRASRGE
jgi:hypothetical protein